MRLYYISDLHLNHHSDTVQTIIQSLNTSHPEDILILAGDICELCHPNRLELHPLLIKFLSLIVKRYRAVIYVFGNHEYHNNLHIPFSSLPTLLYQFKSKYKLHNMYILDNSKCEIDGIEFIGTTLWYQPRLPYYTTSDYKTMYDENQQLITPAIISKLYNRNLRFLSNNINTNSIVITHHAPHNNFIQPKYRDSRLSHAYFNDLSSLIKETNPIAWICGHTHHNTGFKLYATICCSNCYGYPDETTKCKYDRCLIVKNEFVKDLFVKNEFVGDEL